MLIRAHRLTGLSLLAAIMLLSTEVFATPIPGGLPSCPKPDQPLGDCTFTFSGGRNPGVVPGGTTAGPAPLPQYFALAGFTKPRLEAKRPELDDWSSLFHAESFGVDPIGNWSDPVFVFDGFIDSEGNTNAKPQIQGDKVFWYGFAWHWQADCLVATDTTCGQLNVTSNITFRGVRVGEHVEVSVAEPTGLALLGLALAGVMGGRRRLTK